MPKQSAQGLSQGQTQCYILIKNPDQGRWASFMSMQVVGKIHFSQLVTEYLTAYIQPAIGSRGLPTFCHVITACLSAKKDPKTFSRQLRWSVV